MEILIRRINQLMADNGITAYYLAKQTGINQTTLHMILHNKRKMQPSHFSKILEFLPISRVEYNELTILFQICSLGPKKFNAHTTILDTLKLLSDYTYRIVDGGLELPPPYPRYCLI